MDNKIMYLCNKKRCIEYRGECKHTSDVQYAKNFKDKDNFMVEQEESDRGKDTGQ